MVISSLIFSVLVAAGPKKVVVLGPAASPFSVISGLGAALGPGYQVMSFASDDVEGAREQRPAYAVVSPPSGLMFKWSEQRDYFVGIYKAVLDEFKHDRVKVIAVAPLRGNTLLTKAQYDEELLPLIRQSAREESVPFISFASAGEEIEELANYIDAGSRKSSWKVVSVSSEEADEGPARFAIDGDPQTYWHSNYSSGTSKHPHELIIELPETTRLFGFEYTPRQTGENGRIKDFEFYVSNDGKTWGVPAAKGHFEKGSARVRTYFPQAVSARYLRIVSLSELNGEDWTSIGELDILRIGK